MTADAAKISLMSEERGSSTKLAEALKDRSTIYIKQKGTGREALEMISGFEIKNRFHILDNAAATTTAPLFKILEESACCERQCCHNIFSFDLNVLGGHVPDDLAKPYKDEDYVMKLSRECNCTNAFCCLPCCWICSCTQCFGAQKLTVFDKSENVVGTVTEENWTWCGTGYYLIRDEAGTPVFKIEVKCCNLCAQCCCQDVDIMITRVDGTTEVAQMTRKWICKWGNVLLDKDEFKIDYLESTLTPTEKLLLMSSTFLVKYIYFEQSG